MPLTYRGNSKGFFFWLSVYVSYVRTTLVYFFVFLSLILITIFISESKLSIEIIAAYLTLNKEPGNAVEGLSLILVYFIELSPLMAFLELRTLEKERKMEIIASRLRGHIIVVGVGHLGKRVVDRLEKMGIDYVVIVLPESKFTNEKVMELIEKGRPVIFGNALLDSVLLKAGVKNASSIILTPNNDSINALIAKKAKKLNSNLKTVVRIYDDDFAEILAKSGFADEIISTTAIAVDRYILGTFMDISKPKNEPVLVKVHNEELFNGKTILEIEKSLGVNIIGIRRNGKWVKICHNTVIENGDELLLTATPEKLGKIINKRYNPV